ncbi:PadR family transcriptional regulator [Rhodocytophaga rosea]|uniref:PadR family transcriptional regulator n=1 Tax=Rhodocytophaga rosea TaxID=2704465 RepID=A0A6C0GMQ8_9BACT|nr:PadR family transcriptional regulator [Rhodocytophaga rosea]QHT69341.1 PadR family transcriptional regulator [Rhodocytophaga rosea]
MYPQELIKGSLQTIILKLLSEQEKMYGYQITQEIKKQTEGKISITEAAIYPILHKLKAEGELTTEKVKIGERVRIYYSLTQKGNSKAKEKITQLTDYLQTMQELINKPGLQTFTSL